MPHVFYKPQCFDKNPAIPFNHFQTSSTMAVQSPASSAASRRESLSSLYKFNPPPPPPPSALPPPPPPAGPDPLDVSSYSATPKPRMPSATTASASAASSNRYLANSKSSSNLYYVGGVNQLNNNVILPSAPSTQPFSVDQVP